MIASAVTMGPQRIAMPTERDYQDKPVLQDDRRNVFS